MEKSSLKIMTVDEIRTVCEMNPECKKCPLSDKDGYCPFMGVSPNNWGVR